VTLAAIARYGRSAWLASLVALVIVSPGAGVAQSPVPADRAPRPVNPATDQGKGKRSSLTVEVLLVDPDGKPPRAAKALVRIEGAEDPLETNEQGRVRFSGIATTTVTLQIMPVGLNLCRLTDVAVAGPEHVVSVLVDKSAQGKCMRQE